MNRLYRTKIDPGLYIEVRSGGCFSSRDKLVAQISRNFRKAPFRDRPG